MKKIVKIVTFYDDGTFSEATPSAPEPMPQPWSPSTPYQPLPPNPWYQPIGPYQPPYTITCKLADGTTKDITFTTPIVAQTNT